MGHYGVGEAARRPDRDTSPCFRCSLVRTLHTPAAPPTPGVMCIRTPYTPLVARAPRARGRRLPTTVP
eukprot:3512740-Prymnesium_polylepis.1